MFKKSKKGYYFWEEFTKISGIVHGFSMRRFGDMNPKNPCSSQNQGKFLRRLVEIGEKDIVKMNQVHGNNVCFVSFNDRGKEIKKTDGLVSAKKNVFLLATFADCIPVLFLDKDKRIFGIAHAGWRGAYLEIVKEVVETMVKKGSDKSKIMVGIGPSIRVCCYDISKDREMAFKYRFPEMKKIVERRHGKIFLNLSKVIRFQLIDSGVLSKNILDCKLCTKDNALEFYSFRKEHGKSSFGLCAGVIGRT